MGNASRHLVALYILISVVGCSHFQSGRYIEIQAGDSYDLLGQRYDVNPQRLKEMNHGRTLVIGDHIFVPERKGVVAAIQEKMGQTSVSSTPETTNPKVDLPIPEDFEMMWPLPVNKKVSSGFGPRKGKMHMGIDIPAPLGTHILAAAAGRVTFAGWIKGYGKTVVVGHGNGVFTVYAHASKMLVKRGEEVDQGSAVAQVGRTGRSSGPHLHFEVRFRETPLDPLAFYSGQGVTQQFAVHPNQDSQSENEL